MRTVIARLALVLGLTAAALIPTTAGAAADPIPPRPPSPLAGLPADVFHGQVVTLADGDRYEVTFAQQGRNIRGRRWDAATQRWGPHQVIFSDPDLRCWGLHARGAGNGVAVRIGCGPAFVEEWDGHPHAIVTADTETWTSRRLPGYGWWNPGISPAGARAVWARGDDYYTWSAATGFVRRVADPPRDVSEGEAPMITDSGTVTIAYSDDSCSVTFDSYLAPDVPSRQVLAMPEGCNSVGVTPIDANTVAFGDPADEWSTARLTRPDEADPWVVAAIAPMSASGLLEDRYNRDMAPMLLDAPDRPLAVVGNGTGALQVQLYDPALQAWQAPSTLVERTGGTKCRFRNDFTPYLGFYSLALRCAGPDRVVTSTDGGTWTAIPMHAQQAGPNRDVRLLAIPDHTSTVLLGNGTSTTLPVGVDGACDVVVPIAADRALRLTSSRGRDGWPDLLQRSTTEGWRTVDRLEVPRSGICRRVYPGSFAGPQFAFQGPGGSMRARFVEVNGHWDVRVR